MRWYSRISKMAQSEWGHGGTLDGQRMKRTYSEVKSDLEDLKAQAGQLDEVLPRWRGEIRRKIFLLPAVDKLPRMSMHELLAVKSSMDDIKAQMRRYDHKRFSEIIGADNVR